MGNICGAAPSKEANDQPIDHKTAKKVSFIVFITNYTKHRVVMHQSNKNHLGK